MIALPNGGMLPPEWRGRGQIWSDETVALAREYAKDGRGETAIARALELHGVSVSRDTVYAWLRRGYRSRVH